VKRLRLPISLHGLRMQVLLWTVLPLIIFLLVFSFGGVSSHQSSMRALASEEHSRLVIALAELIAVQVENVALRTNIPPQQVAAESLELKHLLQLDHEHAVSMVMVFDDQKRNVFRYGDWDTAADSVPEEIASAAMRGETGVLFTSEHGDIVAYAPVENTEWFVVIRESWHSLTSPLIRYEEVMPFILFTAATISLLILFFGVRYLVRPLRELSVRAAQIGQGNFTHTSISYNSGIKEIADLSGALDDMARRIQNYQASLHDYVGAVTQAQEEERARLGRELHDETVQTLIALGHRAQMVQRSLSRDPKMADERLSELRHMVATAIDEVRRFSRALHPHYLEELGLTSALEMLTREASAAFTCTGTPIRLKPDKELAVYRVAQEALNNARRHAQAGAINMTITYRAESVQLDICDDGIGFTVPDYFYDLTRTGHFGLIGMRERVQLIGGQLEIVSRPGGGTRVSLTVTP
jgi:signal transduction histidine kinase